jgi:hypothetical protein
MERVGIFNGHLVYLFGIFYGHLVYSVIFLVYISRFGKLYQENLATLILVTTRVANQTDDQRTASCY